MLLCFQHKCVGQALFNEVVKKLQILETDYFDLEFTNEHGNCVSMPCDEITHEGRGIRTFIFITRLWAGAG